MCDDTIHFQHQQLQLESGLTGWFKVEKPGSTNPKQTTRNLGLLDLNLLLWETRKTLDPNWRRQKNA